MPTDTSGPSRPDGIASGRPERPGGAPWGRLLAACAAAPPLALTAFVGWTLAVAALGEHPLWHPASLNMSEAAAARDVATIAAMLERGEDPDRGHAVRPPLLDSAPGAFTPVEAGALAGRLEVVHLLLTRGATLDPGRRTELACAALRRGYRDVAEYLVAQGARTEGAPLDVDDADCH